MDNFVLVTENDKEVCYVPFNSLTLKFEAYWYSYAVS